MLRTNQSYQTSNYIICSTKTRKTLTLINRKDQKNCQVLLFDIVSQTEPRSTPVPSRDDKQMSLITVKPPSFSSDCLSGAGLGSTVLQW